MSADVVLTLNERDVAELKRLNRNLAVQAAVLEGDRRGEFHMLYCGFCLALQELGLDGIVDVTKDEKLHALAKLAKDRNMDVMTFSEIMGVIGYSLRYDPETNDVVGFVPKDTDKE